ncbi:MAG: glycosyltransferase family 2 protein [Candidatus Omnitrophica bacterium]|nr:glycosyltransferase family 2 protein [Candidatus Omnitrophota bacterium]
MHKEKSSLSVVLPVYNDSDSLRSSLKYLTETLANDFEDFEIILIDDGNTPDDFDFIKTIAASNDKIKIFRNSINLNLGISLQRGLKEAQKDFILFNSIDLPLSPKDIRSLVVEAADTDILILQRRSYPGATKWRLLTSAVNLLMIKILFPIATKGIRDFNYTFIIRTDALGRLLPLAKSPAFTQPEIILRAKYAKLRTKVIFADYHARKIGSSNLGKPHDIIWSIYDMLRFRLISLFKNIT